jgi:hypothetical protein
MTADWSDYLDPDERLLWTGRPAQGMRYTGKRIGASFVGLFVLGFALFWTAGASAGLWMGEWRNTDTLMFWFFILFPIFGLPFVGLGLYATVGHFFHDRNTRAKTLYALTNRRALILVLGRKVSVKSWPIRPETVIDYEPGLEANIYVATETHTDSEGDKTHTRVGFDLIEDGDKVYRLIRQIQTGEIDQGKP